VRRLVPVPRDLVVHRRATFPRVPPPPVVRPVQVVLDPAPAAVAVRAHRQVVVPVVAAVAVITAAAAVAAE